MYGPLVMCGLTTQDNPVSVIRGEKEKVLKLLKPLVGETIAFTAPGSVFRTSFDKAEGETTFVPFYKEYKRPYAVYWDIFDDARWATKEAQIKAEKERQLALDARRIDGLQIFDQAERDHNFKGENTASGVHLERGWRHAAGKGWFQYELKVLPEGPQSLSCCYWGSDTGRTFDILIDGQKIAEQKLHGEKPDQFFDVEYPIPADLLKGKEKVTVRFQAPANGIAGGVFGCYLLKAK